MSKDIIIQQGGVDQQLDGVEMLRTNEASSGTVDWFPYSEAQLEDLSAVENNTYTPDSGVYGFRMVSVSVPATSITGKGPDGNDYTVTTDGSGNIVETKVPSEIRVVTPPNYVGPYGNGAYLSFEGLTVEALYADGSSAGMVDFEELVFPVTQATYDPEADVSTEMVESDLDAGPITMPFPASLEVKTYDSGSGAINSDDIYLPGKCTAANINDYGNVVIIVASPTQTGLYIDNKIGAEYNYNLRKSYTYNGKTVYYSQLIIGGQNDVSPNCYPGGYVREALTNDTYAGPIAWTMIYGTVTGTFGGVQIPVQYSSPYNGATLETSFGITVVQVIGGNN